MADKVGGTAVQAVCVECGQQKKCRRCCNLHPVLVCPPCRKKRWTAAAAEEADRQKERTRKAPIQ